MPTVLNEQGFRFSFFSSDRGEPPHVHVRGSSGMGKWWLKPEDKERAHGFTRSEERRIEAIIRKHQRYLFERWSGFFSENQ